MRRCPKCGTIAAEDSERCGICGEDLFAVQNESVRDAVSNEEKTIGIEERRMKQEELALEKRAGRMVIVYYGTLVGLIIVGIILTTLQSNFLNVTGILLILFALIMILYRYTPRRVIWIARGTRLGK